MFGHCQFCAGLALSPYALVNHRGHADPGTFRWRNFLRRLGETLSRSRTGNSCNLPFAIADIGDCATDSLDRVILALKRFLRPGWT